MKKEYSLLFLIGLFFLGPKLGAYAAECSLNGPFYDCWVCDFWNSQGTGCGACCESKSKAIGVQTSNEPFQVCKEGSCGMQFGCSDGYYKYSASRSVCWGGECLLETRTDSKSWDANFCYGWKDQCSSNVDCILPTSEPTLPLQSTPTSTLLGPTATPMMTSTPTPTFIPSPTPSLILTPSLTLTLTPTPSLTPMLTVIPTFTPTLIPTLTPTPFPVPTVGVPAAYFQTQNGDVHSGGKINNSNLPAGESLGDFVVSTGNPLVFSDFGAGQASQKGWRLGSYSIANSSDSIWPIFKNGFYQYFTRQFPVGSKPGIKQITSAAQIEKDKTQTYYVDGSLTITQDLEFSSPVSVVVVVKGDLTIDMAVARVDGLFLVDGEVRTGGGNLALVNQGGMAVSNLSRSRLVFQRKPVKPADDLFAPPGELFVGSPKYFVLLNELLGERKITFLETY